MEQNPTLRQDIWAFTDVIGLFWSMDLDRAAPILRRVYSKGGPLAIDPIVMLRAIFLMFFLKIASFGDLVERLAQSAVLRALVGCTTPPGRTTFYDFLARLPGFRAMARKQAKRRLRKRKPKKKYKKGEKPPLRRKKVMELLESLRLADMIPEAEELVKTMNLLLDKGFVSISLERGLIGGPLGLAVAGDSASLVQHASPYGKRTQECDCPPGTGTACPHKRLYSAPDADWNWESSEGRWVFGLRFYELTSARGDELPLAIGMPTKPQQNDAITGYVCLHQYHQLTGRPIYAAYLDSAHDNLPTYNLVRSIHAIPYIDLRMGVPLGDDGRPKVIANTKHIGLGGIDATGTPHCAMGAMVLRGTSKGYQRFDCPAIHTGSECPLQAQCPQRTVHLRPTMSPRYICETPRCSQPWKDEYKRRTTVERSHDRKKNDFGCEHRYNRSRPVVYAMYVFAACFQHVVSWAKCVDGKLLLNSWLADAA